MSVTGSRFGRGFWRVALAGAFATVLCACPPAFAAQDEGSSEGAAAVGDMRAGEAAQADEPSLDQVFVAGLSAVDGSYRFGKEDGTYAAAEWVQVDGRRYYFDAQGLAVAGAAYVDGRPYVFDDSCAQVAGSGWHQWPDGTWSLLNDDSSAVTGWYLYAGRDWYYLDPQTCRTVRGAHAVGSRQYFFDSGCVMQEGWVYHDGGWSYYWPVDGNAATGWLREGGDWYYLDPATAKAAVGERVVAGRIYSFSDSCRMREGWVRNSDGTWSYYRPVDGDAATGWYLYANRDWYYFDPATGHSATGLRQVGSRLYYFDAGSVMQEGWVYHDGGWSYYWPGDGNAATGWLREGGDWYYLDPATAKAAVGERVVGNRTYYFDGSCRMQEGWVYHDGGWSYYWPGDGNAATGWLREGGDWYYLDPATLKMVVWTQRIGNADYYFDGSGRMHTGWLEWSSGGWSFFDPSGARAYGSRTIAGVAYDFGDKGWIEEGPSITGDSKLDRQLIELASRLGSLRACFDWTVDHRHTNWGGADRSYGYARLATSEGWVPSECSRMVGGEPTDCYAYASTFACLARALGYDQVTVVGGYVPRTGGGWASHGWVEIAEGGTPYVYDPSMAHSYTGYNFYGVTYASAPLDYNK